MAGLQVRSAKYLCGAALREAQSQIGHYRSGGVGRVRAMILIYWVELFSSASVMLAPPPKCRPSQNPFPTIGSLPKTTTRDTRGPSRHERIGRNRLGAKLCAASGSAIRVRNHCHHRRRFPVALFGQEPIAPVRVNKWFQTRMALPLTGLELMARLGLRMPASDGRGMQWVEPRGRAATEGA